MKQAPVYASGDEVEITCGEFRGYFGRLVKKSPPRWWVVIHGTPDADKKVVRRWIDEADLRPDPEP